MKPRFVLTASGPVLKNPGQLIGARLKQERERLGITQEVAAIAAGVSREMWGKYERGATPSAAVLMKVKAVGFDVNLILSDPATRTTLETVDEFVAKIKRQSTAPIPLSEYGKGMKSMQRRSTDSHAVLRRQIIRAYGSLGAFSAATGIYPSARNQLLTDCWTQPGSQAAQLKRLFGLPIQVRETTRRIRRSTITGATA